MTSKIKILLTLLFFYFIDSNAQTDFRLGNENFLANNFDLVKNKNIALVVNNSSRLQNGTFLVDTLLALDVNVKKIFTLEHGLFTNYAAGENVRNDYYKGIPVVSLYGKKKTPTEKDLTNIDAIIYDVQDVGARFFTYISSLKLILEKAAKYGKTFIVLDRPNPQGRKIEGEILDRKLISFVGIAELPVLYGMTCGELAKYFAENIEKEDKHSVKLIVIPMSGYLPDKFDFPEKFIPPSPNLRTKTAIALYPGLCFLEGSNISEGRGSDAPFEQFGAPFINAGKVIAKLNKTDFTNALEFLPVEFTPKGKGKYSPKYAGKLCKGIRIKIKNKNFNSVLFGAKLLKILARLYPEKIKFNYDWLAKLYGNRNLEFYLKDKISFGEIVENQKRDKLKFEKTGEKFLIY